MGLTPSNNDPKRKEELARAKKDPGAFGQPPNKSYPKDWSKTGLKNNAKDAEAAEKARKAGEEAEAQKAVEAEEAMKALIDSVPDMDDEELELHKNSLNQELFDAVDRELASRSDDDENNKE